MKTVPSWRLQPSRTRNSPRGATRAGLRGRAQRARGGQGEVWFRSPRRGGGEATVVTNEKHESRRGRFVRAGSRASVPISPARRWLAAPRGWRPRPLGPRTPISLSAASCHCPSGCGHVGFADADIAWPSPVRADGPAFPGRTDLTTGFRIYAGRKAVQSPAGFAEEIDNAGARSGLKLPRDGQLTFAQP